MVLVNEFVNSCQRLGGLTSNALHNNYLFAKLLWPSPSQTEANPQEQYRSDKRDNSVQYWAPLHTRRVWVNHKNELLSVPTAEPNSRCTTVYSSPVCWSCLKSQSREPTYLVLFWITLGDERSTSLDGLLYAFIR